MFTNKEREANMLPKTKCPCENCLLIPACNNRSTMAAINVVSSIDKCSLLKDFLDVNRVSKSFTDFDSQLSREELEEKLDQVNIYIPIGTLHLIK
jgi:hypothetical protein